MSASGFLLTIAAALITAISNILLRVGVLRAGGFGLSPENVAGDLWRLGKEPSFIIGILLYGLAALFWFRIISSENLATGYVVLVSVAFIAVNIGGYFVFREPVTVQKLVGLAVILMGIALVARSS